MTNFLFRLAHHFSQVTQNVSQYLGGLNHLADQETSLPGEQARRPIEPVRMPVKNFQQLKQYVMQKSRGRKLDEFYALCPVEGPVLDVGVSNNDYSPQINLFMKSFRFDDGFYTGLAIEPMDEAAKAHPGKTFVVYDGGRFPFSDRSFDAAFSNAVIEHVGDDRAQLLFINEMLRTARQVYFTTPNKFFPVESHTNALFIHWWSGSFYKWCRRHRPYWTERNLRLLSHGQLAALLKRSNAGHFEIRRNRMLGMTMTFSVICRGAQP